LFLTVRKWVSRSFDSNNRKLLEKGISSAHCCGLVRVPTGQGKLEKVGEIVWSEKGHGKILRLKSLGK